MASSAAADPVASSVEDEKRERRVKFKFNVLLRKVLQPPVIATLVGLVLAITKPHSWLVDTYDRNNDAPMEWAFNAIRSVGDMAVPMQLILLGASFAEGVDFKRISRWTNAGIVLAKLVVMPLIGLGTALALRMVFKINDGLDGSFYLVVMIVHSTPTSNSIIMMSQLSGQDDDALMACVLTQYLVAPVTLTFFVAWFTSIVQNY